LGLSGKADVVDFVTNGSKRSVYPVEYKLGKKKMDNSDAAQLCAQALCLEEMLGYCIQTGALFYGRQQRRAVVNFDETLRDETETVIHDIHDMVKKRDIPAARYAGKCKSCSLYSQCMPKVSGRKTGNYIKELFTIHEETS
jgi:CRISPR-associated exonuclease Cas4